MKTYEKPIIIENKDLAEGVFAASGCYTTRCEIHQNKENGRNDYRIQVNSDHNADHNSDKNQCLHIIFNQPVSYISSGGTLESGDGTNTITIGYAYWNNHVDHIGLGDIVVTSEDGLTVTKIWMEDRAKQY